MAKLTKEEIARIGKRVDGSIHGASKTDVRELIAHITEITPDAELGANVRLLAKGDGLCEYVELADCGDMSFVVSGRTRDELHNPIEMWSSDTLDTAVAEAVRAAGLED